jgi:hypothetical protein
MVGQAAELFVHHLRVADLLAQGPMTSRISGLCSSRMASCRAITNPGIAPAVIAALATCDWVRKGQPLCLIGDSGTGNSHLLIALGTAAAMAGFRVRYTLASKLANELAEAAGRSGNQ